MMIPLSAINQYLYCPRRAALIHVEGIFIQNEHTLAGDMVHEAVDFPGFEKRAGWELLRALPLFSESLGLSGKADLVEVRRGPGGAPAEIRPVEYKRGPQRKFDNDEAQLCAQAFCLEEMFGLPIAEGAVFHAKSQKRRAVPFTPELRAHTRFALAALHALVASARVPAAELRPQCEGCSLHEICLPELSANATRLARVRSSLFTVTADDQ